MHGRSRSPTTCPPGLTFVSADGDGWTCAEAARVVTCDLTGPLAAGADATPISLVVTVEPGAYPGVDNTATVDSATPDTDPRTTPRPTT